MSTTTPLADPRDEVRRLLGAAEELGLVCRATGGVAIALRCPTASRPPLARVYKDIDLVARWVDATTLSELLERLGYIPDQEFNALHGHQRLYFWDRTHGRQLDIFIDRIVMCHTLDVRDRLARDALTLPLADLLLTKLQIVEVNAKDLQDAAALLTDHDLGPDGIEVERIVEVLSADWGWWRTATASLARVTGFVARLGEFRGKDVVEERAARLLDRIDAAPKSLRWRARARVGERVRWFELPEEIKG